MFQQKLFSLGVHGGAMTPDFMKSRVIAPLLHSSNWIVLVETPAFTRFWVDFMRNRKTHLQGIVTLCFFISYVSNFLLELSSGHVTLNSGHNSILLINIGLKFKKDHYAQMRADHRRWCTHPGFTAIVGGVNRSPKQRVPVVPQNGDLSLKKIKKKKKIFDIISSF